MAKFTGKQILVAMFALDCPVKATWFDIESMANIIYPPPKGTLYVSISSAQRKAIEPIFEEYREACEGSIKNVAKIFRKVYLGRG